MGTKSRKIAIFKTPYGESVVDEIGEGIDSYTRLSEYVTVSFPELPIAETIANQLSVLDRQEQTARARFQEVIDKIDDERGKLKSLTHVVSE